MSGTKLIPGTKTPTISFPDLSILKCGKKARLEKYIKNVGNLYNKLILCIIMDD